MLGIATFTYHKYQKSVLSSEPESPDMSGEIALPEYVSLQQEEDRFEGANDHSRGGDGWTRGYDLDPEERLRSSEMSSRLDQVSLLNFFFPLASIHHISQQGPRSQVLFDAAMDGDPNTPR
jgi:hypothetical protein